MRVRMPFVMVGVALVVGAPIAQAGSISRDLGGTETITADVSDASVRTTIELEVRTDDPGAGTNPRRVWSAAVFGPPSGILGRGIDGQGCSAGGLAGSPTKSFGACERPLPFGQSFAPVFALNCPLHAATTVFLPRAVAGARLNDRMSVSCSDKDDVVHGDGAPGPLSVGLDVGDDRYISGLGREAFPEDIRDQLRRENQPPGGVNVSGGIGDDTLSGAPGNLPIVEVLGGGPGDDTITDADHAIGGDGDDDIRLGKEADGDDGNDRITDVTTARGGAGSDRIASAVRVSTLDGGLGNDVLSGSQVKLMAGGAGDDRLTVSGVSRDFILPTTPTARGDAGDDTLTLGAQPMESSTTVNGGLGSDLLSLEARTADQSVTVDGEANDGTRGEQLNVIGFDRFRLGAGDDFFFSFTDDAPDQVDGGPGDDRILPGDGPDLLIGGAGVDTLNGGAGDDTFLAQDGERDTITCASGSDAVTADLADAPTGRISGCETVRTSPRGEPLPASIARGATVRRGRVHLGLRCPAHRSTCRGTVSVRRAARVVGRAAFAVPAGGERRVAVAVAGTTSALTAALTERGRTGLRRSTTLLRPR